MALYGINSYLSNSYYTSLLSGYNSQKKQTNSMSDLASLMKRVDQVRSRSYRKNMLEEYKKIFSASNDEVGSLESESSLSDTAKKLNSSASAMATGNIDFSDKEGSMKSMKSFIEDYNSTIDALQKSGSVDALKQGVNMTNTTKVYARTLARVGISLGSDNKLTLNEDKYGKAYDTTLKALFSGSYSYAGKIANKASGISRSAALKAQLTYNNQGNLDYFTKLSLNSMFSDRI